MGSNEVSAGALKMIEKRQAQIERISAMRTDFVGWASFAGMAYIVLHAINLQPPVPSFIYMIVSAGFLVWYVRLLTKLGLALNEVHSALEDDKKEIEQLAFISLA